MKEDHHSYAIDANFAVAKRKLEKIQVCTGFEHLYPACHRQFSGSGSENCNPLPASL